MILAAIRPTHLAVPERIGSAGQAACDIMARADHPMDPWQALTLDIGLSLRERAQWAAFEMGLIVPRQNGKGSVLEGKAMHALYDSPSRLVLWSAHEFKTAQEGFLRMKALIDNTDEFRKQVQKITTSHGEEGITLRNGKRLRFVARSRGSGRGFAVDDVILDEGYALKQVHIASLLPTLSARSNPQVWYTSSAPLEDSDVLRSVMKRGRVAASPRLAYVEFCAPDGASSDDPGARRAANPATGIRIAEEFLDAEFEAMGDTEEYRRERLGIVNLETDHNQALNQVAWRDCEEVRDLAALRERMTCVVDAAPDGRSVALVAAVRDGQLVRVEPVAEWQSMAEARLELPRALLRVRPAAFGWFPDGPAAALAASLKTLQGVCPVAIRGEVPAVCMSFADLVESRTIRHSGDPLLSSQVAAAEPLSIGDRWVFTRRGAGQVNMLYAAAGAAHLALGMRARRERRDRVMSPA